MKKIKSHFHFNKQERNGIFFLLLLIILLQGSYFLIKWNSSNLNSDFKLSTQEQKKIDSLKITASPKDSIKIFPFNPNFITDYKGYTLGMSPEEIDRLYAYRQQNRFVNSASEFQQVTQVSDSLLVEIAPFFKFPEWAQRPRIFFPKSMNKISKRNAVGDLNLATADELKQINGIGEKLSARIVKFRDRLGGFLVVEQLYDVYGLEPKVVERAMKRFEVVDPPKINTININAAPVDELASLVYIPYDMAERIIMYRQENGRFESFDELTVIQGFPKEKIERIKLYLSLK